MLIDFIFVSLLSVTALSFGLVFLRGALLSAKEIRTNYPAKLSFWICAIAGTILVSAGLMLLFPCMSKIDYQPLAIGAYVVITFLIQLIFFNGDKDNTPQ